MKKNVPTIATKILRDAFKTAALTINGGHRVTLYNFPALHFAHGNACISIAHEALYNIEAN